MRHHTRARTVRPLLAALFAAVLGLAACTDGGTSPDPTANGPEPPGTTVAATVTGTATAATTTKHLGSPDLSEKRQGSSVGAQVDITNIRVGRHAHFDRVVLDLRGEGTPGWIARFNANPVEDGSGFPVEYEGETSLELAVTGLAMPGDDYRSIGTVPGAGGVVTEVIPGGWFEGMDYVVIGLTGERPYSIQLLENPPRLVVDILHQPASPTSTPPATSHLGSPDLSDKRQDPSLGAQVDITNARVGRHAHFDRVVLDLRGEGSPGWIARFNPDPVQDGSGFPVEYEGETSLELAVTGLAMPGDDYRPIGTVPGAGGVVTEVIPGGWVEGMDHVVIGLPGERPYSIQLLENPPRLVVDILHRSATPTTGYLGNPDLSDKRQDPSAGAQADVTNVRVGRHADFDRVVLDLRGEGTPGWIARFDAAPVQDGSGLPVEYEGATSIHLAVTGLAMPGDDHRPIGTVPGAGGVVTEVVTYGWFEGQNQVIIGLPEELPYSIQILENPQRMVIDILHE